MASLRIPIINPRHKIPDLQVRTNFKITIIKWLSFFVAFKNAKTKEDSSGT